MGGGLREEHPLVLRNRNPRAPRRSPRSALLLRPVPALLDQEMVLRRVGEDQLRRLPLPKDPRGGDGNLREQWRAALQQGGAARELRGVFWMLARLQPRLDLNSVREKGGGKVAIIFRFSSCILRVWARL